MFKILSRELQTLFATLSPNESEWKSVVLEPNKDQQFKMPSNVVKSRSSDSPMVVRIKNLGRSISGYNFEIRVSWKYSDEEWNRENPDTFLTLIYGVDRGALERYYHASDHSKSFEDFPYELSEGWEAGDPNRYKIYAPEAYEELIEIGRAIGRKLNIDITIPDADKGRGF